MELNEYIENIRKDGEYAGIIEMAIATKLFSINIFIYKEEDPISNKYILYEKIDTDNNNYDQCNLLFENGNHFSILLEKKIQYSKRKISTPTILKNNANLILLKLIMN